MTRKTPPKKISVLILSLLIFSTLMIITPAIAGPPAPDPEPTITFLGWQIVKDGIKFRYQVTSGSKPSLSHWELHSCVFNNENLIRVSEKFEIKNQCLKFDKGYEDYETREVWFILNLDYYGLIIDKIPYHTTSGGGNNLFRYKGEVDGPICPTPTSMKSEIPRSRARPNTSLNMYARLGTPLSLLLAIGLVSVVKFRVITIEVD